MAATETSPLRRWTYSLGFVLALLMSWSLISRFGPWPKYLFPGPLAVGDSLWNMLREGQLGSAVLTSLRRLVQGYAVSVLIGVPLGIANARFPFFRSAVKPVLMGLQGLPSVCWLPLSLLWFGLSDAAIIFVVVMGSLLSVAIATEDAILGIEPQILRVAGSYGVRGARLWVGVLLPAALPGIFTGLKLGWSFAWRALMAGELLFVSGGLGQLLNMGRELMEVAQVMAVMVAIIGIGTSVDRFLFQSVETRIRRAWGLVAVG